MLSVFIFILRSPDKKKPNDETGKKQGGAGPEGAVGMYISCYWCLIQSCIFTK